MTAKTNPRLACNTGLSINVRQFSGQMADRRLCGVQVFNLNSPHQVYKELESPLKYQTRCIACFPDTTGYLIGSIEGRVAVHHVEDAQQVGIATSITSSLHGQPGTWFIVQFEDLQGYKKRK